MGIVIHSPFSQEEINEQVKNNIPILKQAIEDLYNKHWLGNRGDFNVKIADILNMELEIKYMNCIGIEVAVNVRCYNPDAYGNTSFFILDGPDKYEWGILDATNYFSYLFLRTLDKLCGIRDKINKGKLVLQWRLQESNEWQDLIY